jgi:hypothetical protein
MDNDSDRCLDSYCDAAPNVSNGVISSFVLDQGLMKLYQFEKQGQAGRTQPTRQALAEFKKLRRDRSSRIAAYHVSHDALWLVDPTNDFQYLSLDVGFLFRVYKEEETGPAEAWYHTLLQAHSEHLILEDAANGPFKCQRCMNEFGYMFWDHQRLDHSVRYNPFPTLDILRTASTGLIINRDELSEGTWGRAQSRDDICYCSGVNH